MIVATLLVLSHLQDSATPVEDQPLWKQYQHALHATGDIYIHWSEMAGRVKGRMTPAFIRPMWAKVHDPNQITVGNGPETNEIGQWDGTLPTPEKGFWMVRGARTPMTDFQVFIANNRFLKGTLYGPVAPPAGATAKVWQESTQLPTSGEIHRHWSAGADNSVDEVWKFGSNGLLTEYDYSLDGIAGPQPMEFKINSIDTSKKPEGWWK